MKTAFANARAEFCFKFTVQTFHYIGARSTPCSSEAHLAHLQHRRKIYLQSRVPIETTIDAPQPYFVYWQSSSKQVHPTAAPCPQAPGSRRSWHRRKCWVVQALLLPSSWRMIPNHQKLCRKSSSDHIGSPLRFMNLETSEGTSLLPRPPKCMEESSQPCREQDMFLLS